MASKLKVDEQDKNTKTKPTTGSYPVDDTTPEVSLPNISMSNPEISSGSTGNNSSVYEELFKKENSMKHTLKRLDKAKKQRENSNRLLNQSLTTIGKKTVRTLYDIVSDISRIKKLNVESFQQILFRDQRYKYVGVALVCTSLLFMIIQL